jgi:hypothetical protein
MGIEIVPVFPTFLNNESAHKVPTSISYIDTKYTSKLSNILLYTLDQNI